MTKIVYGCIDTGGGSEYLLAHLTPLSPMCVYVWCEKEGEREREGHFFKKVSVLQLFQVYSPTLQASRASCEGSVALMIGYTLMLLFLPESNPYAHTQWTLIMPGSYVPGCEKSSYLSCLQKALILFVSLFLFVCLFVYILFVFLSVFDFCLPFCVPVLPKVRVESADEGCWFSSLWPSVGGSSNSQSLPQRMCCIVTQRWQVAQID